MRCTRNRIGQTSECLAGHLFAGARSRSDQSRSSAEASGSVPRPNRMGALRAFFGFFLFCVCFAASVDPLRVFSRTSPVLRPLCAGLHPETLLVHGHRASRSIARRPPSLGTFHRPQSKQKFARSKPTASSTGLRRCVLPGNLNNFIADARAGRQTESTWAPDASVSTVLRPLSNSIIYDLIGSRRLNPDASAFEEAPV